ncbi:copper amine oxidase N-terminal domain-containing protein [Aneurinibacillus sp. BA2021]|nr:copper amine oxidase N-terminal domain-containing protein [Aneurinibacillus sp. BA2021]
MRSAKERIAVRLVTMLFFLTSQFGIFPAKGVALQETIVKINGSQVNFPDDKPYIDTNTGRTMVPIRFISEKLGAKVDWNNAERKAIIQKDGKTIVLPIGSNTAMVNGKPVTFDAPAVLKGVRTFVPLRFISEAYGAKVDWDAKTGVVKITTNSQDVIKQLNNVTVTTVPVDLQQNITVKADPKVRSAVDNWAKSIVVNGDKVTFTTPNLPSGYSMAVALFGEEDFSFHQSYNALKSGVQKTLSFPDTSKKPVVMLTVYGKGSVVVDGMVVRLPSLQSWYTAK